MTDVRRPTDVLMVHHQVSEWWRRSPFTEHVASAFWNAISPYTANLPPELHGRVLASHPELTGSNMPLVPTKRDVKRWPGKANFELPDDAKWMATDPNRHLQDEKGVTNFQQLMTRYMVASEPLFVRSHIVDRLWGMAKKYQGSADLLPDDLVVKNGYAWLETPIYTSDIRGRVVSIRAIGWHSTRDGVIVFWFNDLRDPLDELSAEISEKNGARLSKLGLTHAEAESRTPLFHAQPWPWGESVRARAYYDRPEDHPNAVEYLKFTTYDNMRRSFEDAAVDYNFQFMLWEFIASQYPTVQRADRALSRRLARFNKPNEIKVIEMRPLQNHSVYDPEHQPEKVEWSHRWVVREHKRRWQDRKTGEWRETTVAAYVKGPEDRPLVLKEAVYDVKR